MSARHHNPGESCSNIRFSAALCTELFDMLGGLSLANNCSTDVVQRKE